MQTCDQKQTSQKIAQKTDLEGFGPPFGRGLGRRFGLFFVALGHFWIVFFAENRTLIKHWSKMNSKRLLDRFGVNFGRVLGGLGRIWETLGKIWALKIEAFASHGRLLSTLCVRCSLTLCYRNPRVASLRLAERHNTRGFRPQTRVRQTLTSGFSVIELT